MPKAYSIDLRQRVLQHLEKKTITERLQASYFK